MAKCILCGMRKANRHCSALEREICSLCCGTKRENEISCPSSCEYLKRGKEYQVGREVAREMSAAFQSEADDIFQIEEAIDFALPIESSFVNWFYKDKTVNDNDIYDALSRVYAYWTGKIPSLRPESRCEEIVFGICQEADESLPKISRELKNKTILRIMRSIRSTSGGILGNRNYLEMIYSQLRPNGRWSRLFRR